jgi:alpha-glucosidase (family GH31 glycosyl hydrolase)
MREALQFRAKLVPYLYTSARVAYDTGVSIVHPMYYHWPEYREAYTFKTQYMLGESVLVTPVVQPMPADSTLVPDMQLFVPPGEWIDWQTGHTITGPVLIRRSFTIRETGVYVRAGSIIVSKVVPEYVPCSAPTVAHEKLRSVVGTNFFLL